MSSEDYEETGLIDLTQLREAIQSVFDDLEPDILDWMLYFTYSNSKGFDKMQYKFLVQMIDDALEK